MRAHQRRVVYHVRDVVVKAIDLWCRPEAATVEDVEEAEAEEAGADDAGHDEVEVSGDGQGADWVSAVHDGPENP